MSSAIDRLNSAEILALPDGLVVHDREADGRDLPYIVIDAEGRIHGFNGHVDLGTGIRTALAQIVAEELDADPASVRILLGDTARTPNQGATIASDTVQTSAVPLRAAAAQARAALLGLAARSLSVPPEDLRIDDGAIAHGNHALSFAELLKGQRIRLRLDRTQAVKDPQSYSIVGKSAARVDIPDKVTGELTFVHDMRVEGMLHGRVVRPPYAGIDGGDFVGTSLISVDRASVAHLPGIVAVVTEGDFVGVVAEREEIAELAMHLLAVEWKPAPPLRDMENLADAIGANPSQARHLHEQGDVDAAIADAATPMDRTYVWPYQMHASIGPSCAVAEWRDGFLRVWSGTQNPHPMRADLARLLDIPVECVDVVRMEASGCYGRNCADDVTADAALLARAAGAPVRVQLTREQEHLWEPKGTGQLMQVRGALDAAGAALAYDYKSRYPSNGAPTLALLLTGKLPNQPETWEMGDRTSVAPYAYPNKRVVIHDTPPIVRASWLRGVSALPSSFAHESWIDEAAAMAGVDPVEYRLRYLTDKRGIAVVEATAERSGWTPHTRPQTIPREGDWLRGRGFAYALYVHSKFPGYGAAWAAWVADVAVNARTGEVRVEKVTVGHDAGLMINPDGVRHQIHGNVIQSTSRALMEQVPFDQSGVAALEWSNYPLITFPDVPEIDVLMVPRPDEPPLGAGESASVPSAAAIANALYDATGIRFREPPFTPEKIRAALAERGLLLAPEPSGPPPAPKTIARKWRWSLSGLGAGLAAGFAIAMPWRPAIPSGSLPPPGFYSPQTLERGRQLAAAGDCAVCHTAEGGETNAGGRPMETPFGIVYSTNITPDPVNGIGNWSLPAFTRAMREGISRDGRHLYPAFPYTAFAKLSDTDIEALYAYLTSRPAVDNAPPRTRLAFPFNMRAGLAAWNATFHDPRPWRDDPARSAQWNRGGYLVEGAGHCSACHTPRNIAGAEVKGRGRYAGALVDGWWAPALSADHADGVPWSEQDFYEYLRHGQSARHGVAGGPMAPVIEELQALPDADLHAMAAYLASLGHEKVALENQEDAVTRLEALAQDEATALKGSGARAFETACAVCHVAGPVPTFGARPSLAVNSAVRAPVPDNLIRTILYGADSRSFPARGAMPGFSKAMSDQQLEELVRYVRARFASDKPAWTDIKRAISSARHKH
ncbi:molybdopterin cofactor-binding domain-containing protein [Sphingobium sp. Sx8-8]|uniref:molybdopterin cofactor-binding domain-containing protein n=1 Tax=Sphingobium sp. Sx8-8 TaxID=2933617 RepID=UPI001F566D1B|nr:molybdopterin cofactor-binding domain-containing protein [Sphingobium sp. Sx8-8]